MSYDYNNTLDNLIKSFEKIVDIKLKTNTKVVKGVVVSSTNEICTVKIDGVDYKMKDSNKYTIGKTVFVCRPTGGTKEQFILNSIATSTTPISDCNIEFKNWDM